MPVFSQKMGHFLRSLHICEWRKLPRFRWRTANPLKAPPGAYFLLCSWPFLSLMPRVSLYQQRFFRVTTPDESSEIWHLWYCQMHDLKSSSQERRDGPIIKNTSALSVSTSGYWITCHYSSSPGLYSLIPLTVVHTHNSHIHTLMHTHTYTTHTIKT